MATTLTKGILTVKIEESLLLNGVSQGSYNTLELSNITTVYKRIINVPTSEIEIYTTHASDIAGSQFDKDLVKYMRITNKDGANFIIIRLKDGVGSGDEFVYKLLAGESFLLHSHQGSMSAALGATAGAPNGDIVSVKLQADTAAIDCEIFLASA